MRHAHTNAHIYTPTHALTPQTHKHTLSDTHTHTHTHTHLGRHFAAVNTDGLAARLLQVPTALDLHPLADTKLREDILRIGKILTQIYEGMLVCGLDRTVYILTQIEGVLSVIVQGCRVGHNRVHSHTHAYAGAYTPGHHLPPRRSLCRAPSATRTSPSWPRH